MPNGLPRKIKLAFITQAAIGSILISLGILLAGLAVREAVFGIMEFWLDRGVDGFRLDAIPYLIEREGTSNENLRETHEVIKELRSGAPPP